MIDILAEPELFHSYNPKTLGAGFNPIPHSILKVF
jgi:hypothetical protein